MIYPNQQIEFLSNEHVTSSHLTWSSQTFLRAPRMSCVLGVARRLFAHHVFFRRGFFGKQALDEDALEMLGSLPDDRAMVGARVRACSLDLEGSSCFQLFVSISLLWSQKRSLPCHPPALCGYLMIFDQSIASPNLLVFSLCPSLARLCWNSWSKKRARVKFGIPTRDLAMTRVPESVVLPGVVHSSCPNIHVCYCLTHLLYSFDALLIDS